MPRLYLIILIAALSVASCGGSKMVSEEDFDVIEVGSPIDPSSVNMIPKAKIYRTNLPSDSLVPITVSPNGQFVTSFPAKSDLVNPPVHLVDGWLLDRRGIQPSSVFTRFTYADYETPADPNSLLRELNRSVRVTEIVELPMPYGEVTPAIADSLIRAGLPGCKTLYKGK